MSHLLWAWAISGVLLWSAVASAATPAATTPASDATVLLRVPPRTVASELETLRQAARAAPQDALAVAAWARAAIERGRLDADPRWFGYAQAALASWQAQAAPPPDLWVLRATLAQQRHDFAAALADLDALLLAHPDHAQARLTRAVIHLVQGRTREALRDCGALLGRANNLITVSCLADARSRSGAALEARAALAALLATPEARSASAAEKNWALTLAAELAARLESPDAPAAFDAALAAGADAYLKTAHADWLLAQQRAADVVALYGREQHSDNLLVRVAIAQQLKADPQAAATRSLLETRFATARARGDALHEREEALLALRTGSGEALPLAQENWQTQREPFDAQLLLEASLAARDRAAAAPVLDWMRDTQIQDPALLRLRAQLEAAP